MREIKAGFKRLALESSADITGMAKVYANSSNSHKIEMAESINSLKVRLKRDDIGESQRRNPSP
jgi:hypothetical protein